MDFARAKVGHPVNLVLRPFPFDIFRGHYHLLNETSLQRGLIFQDLYLTPPVSNFHSVRHKAVKASNHAEMFRVETQIQDKWQVKSFKFEDNRNLRVASYTAVNTLKIERSAVPDR